jgi:hypothetical protein
MKENEIRFAERNKLEGKRKADKAMKAMVVDEIHSLF